LFRLAAARFKQLNLAAASLKYGQLHWCELLFLLFDSHSFLTFGNAEKNDRRRDGETLEEEAQRDKSK
jgi:hypothetical protein